MNKQFEVVVCCQGQPFVYRCKTLVGALAKYAYEYLKHNRYGTMNFTLRQTFEAEGE